jgi:PAS domain S-box-containing protein
MPTMLTTDGSARPGVVPAVAAGTAVLVGSLVLLGWLLDVPALRTLLPGTNPMVASTAVCFILTGVSLWLQRQPAGQGIRWAARTLALAAAAVGLLKLSEYVLGWNLGLDQTLNAIDPGPFPGEMALLTAITFLLSGTALAILDLETRRGGRPAQVLAVVAMLPPIFGLIGRLFGVPTLSSVLAGTVVMALHTGLAFLALCAGILAARPDRGLMRTVTAGGPAGYLMRRVLPGAALVLLAVGWLRLLGERADLYGPEFGVALMVVITLVLLALQLWASARSVQRSAESAAKLVSIVESSDDAIYSKSPDGILTSWNSAAERLYGHRAEEALGRPVSILIPHYRTGEEHVILGQVLEGKTVRHYETERVRKDGTPVPVSLSVSPIRDASGKVIGAASIARDISERRATDEALRRARDKAKLAHKEAEANRRVAEEANRAKSEFLSRMSHELRTPLNAILGFGQLMEMEDLDPDSKESVGQIIRAGRHLLALINEVLDISRIEGGTLSLSLEPVSLGDLATEAAEMVRPMAAERNITMQTDPGELRARYVLADRQRLKQVILNLLSNAVKYNREDGRVRMSLRSTDEGRVRLEVVDSGQGIAEAEIGRLFLPFQRLGAEATGVEGTGLGLALSKGLVVAMGGTIGASSVPGEGTTFWVDLTEAETPSALVGLDDGDPIPTSSSDGERTILYVEDNVPNLRLVEQVAARRPHIRLLSAMQGQMGIDLARQHRPDLILLDLHLPDMSGEEVLRTLREDPVTSAIPVVMISADATSSTAKRLLEAGARSFLTKPLDMRRFVRLIEGE